MISVLGLISTLRHYEEREPLCPLEGGPSAVTPWCWEPKGLHCYHPYPVRPCVRVVSSKYPNPHFTTKTDPEHICYRPGINSTPRCVICKTSVIMLCHCCSVWTPGCNLPVMQKQATASELGSGHSSLGWQS